MRLHATLIASSHHIHLRILIVNVRRAPSTRTMAEGSGNNNQQQQHSIGVKKKKQPGRSNSNKCAAIAFDWKRSRIDNVLTTGASKNGAEMPSIKDQKRQRRKPCHICEQYNAAIHIHIIFNYNMFTVQTRRTNKPNKRTANLYCTTSRPRDKPFAPHGAQLFRNLFGNFSDVDAVSWRFRFGCCSFWVEWWWWWWRWWWNDTKHYVHHYDPVCCAMLCVHMFILYVIRKWFVIASATYWINHLNGSATAAIFPFHIWCASMYARSNKEGERTAVSTTGQWYEVYLVCPRTRFRSHSMPP